MKNYKLLKLRLENKKTQLEIAKIIGISKQHYCRLENNQQQGSLKVIKKLAKYFNATIDDLLEQDVKEKNN